MSTERFSIAEFETVLNSLKAITPPIIKHWSNVGYIGSELRYRIWVKSTPKNNTIYIEVNSSIGTSGVADPSGDNSIRAWLVDSTGQSLGSKTQQYVTRVKGWDGRTLEMLKQLASMGHSIQDCGSCDELEHVFISKTEKNNGRLFAKCANGCSFRWLDEGVSPDCPKCTGQMVKRTGRNGEFWGCKRFPNCNGTRELDDLNPSRLLITLAGRTATQQQLPLDVPTTKPADTTKGITPSNYQSSIYDWAESGTGNLVVEALAGSGKTTTGIEMLKRVKGKVLFLAYNAHIKDELAKRAPSHVKVMTLHGLGFDAIRKAFQINVNQVDDDKVFNILKNFMDVKQDKNLIAPIQQLVSLVKGTLSDTDDDSLREIAYRYSMPLNGDEAFVFNATRYVIEMSAKNTKLIDFDDMCWFPVLHDLPMTKYDLIFVDEAQDINMCQIELVLKSMGPNTRVVAVGDRYQSIYGFRGADVNAIPNIIKMLDAQVKPLPITYRNPKSVVKLANERFPHIKLECPDWAAEGSVSDVGYSKALDMMVDGDMVLCRCNAPLMKPALSLIRRGVKAVVRGRDIGKGLLALIKKFKVGKLVDLMYELEQYKQREVEKLRAANKSGQAQTIADRVETIVALSDGVFTITELEQRIDSIFSDKVNGVVFSTVHKAKGLEALNVFILKPELMPHPSAEQDWERQQEANIEYVAITRSKHTLVFVTE